MRRLGLLLVWTVSYAAAICDFITQQPGQYCHDLAVRCKISDADFFKYNPNIKSDCSNLSAGSKVCCGPGGLAPGPDADGRCAVYQVNPGDNCGAIGGQYGLTIDQINSFNFKSTTSFGGSWGFRGCQNLQPGKICISKGTKGPIPALQKDAQGNPVSCGPTASGNGTNVQCPLKACCNNWGQCGISDDFCKITDPSLNPGVSGCQDNCDIKYVKGDPPKSFIKVGYYESWNQGWVCMNSRIGEIDLSNYTHIHYAFADIDTNANVIMDKYGAEQIQSFKLLTGVKRIISFGGWGVSTSPTTFQHLRLMVQSPDKYVPALVKFVTDNNFDGIDIDWEYPGAPDIPGIPPGLPTDGTDYLAFLKLLRSQLPSGKSISIAAPASYWYLKNFPIVDISKVVDYIVFMTYDLHGQWDYKIPSIGPYLNSHVNWTETESMLNLITHAGVESNKVLLGLATYGRSFQQVDPSCYTPDCKFTGPDSGATPGKCTNTAGYMGLAEIKEITDVRHTYTEAGSTIMTWGKDQWVSYLTNDQLADRTNTAKSMNLGGTITWAIDLDQTKPAYQCDMSRVLYLDNLESNTCTAEEKRAFLVDYIQAAISYWDSHKAKYEQGMTAFNSYYNITKPHPPQSDYDNVFTTMTNFINGLDPKTVDDKSLSLLFFYAKRCAVFYSEKKDNKKRYLVSSFGPAGMYIELQDMAATAASAIPEAVAAGTEVAAGIGATISAALPVIGEIALVGGAVIALFAGLWNAKSTPVPDSVITLAQNNQHQSEIVANLIMNPKNITDYYDSISSVDYGYPIDGIEDDIIPGPYSQIINRYNLRSINSPYKWDDGKTTTDCATDDAVDTNNKQVNQLMTALTNKKKEKVGIPVYWINYHASGNGPSPGVACNSWYYFSYKLESGSAVSGINSFTKHDNGEKVRRYYLNKYNCAQYGTRLRSDGKTVSSWDRDEFPFAAANEGEIHEGSLYEIAVSCVFWEDNQSDGRMFGQFVQAYGIYAPWNDHIVGQESGPRQRALQPGDPFIIKIYDMPDTNTCPQFAQVPDETNNYPNVVNYFYNPGTTTTNNVVSRYTNTTKKVVTYNEHKVQSTDPFSSNLFMRNNASLPKYQVLNKISKVDAPKSGLPRHGK